MRETIPSACHPWLVGFIILFRWGSSSAEEMIPSNTLCHTVSTQPVLMEVCATTMVHSTPERTARALSTQFFAWKEPQAEQRGACEDHSQKLRKSYKLASPLRSQPVLLLVRWNPTKFSGFPSESSFVLMVQGQPLWASP